MIKLESYDKTVFDDLANILQSEAIRFKHAMNAIAEAISIKSTTTLLQLTQYEIVINIDTLTHLLHIQQLFHDLMNSIHREISNLMPAVADRSTGLVAPVVSSLSNVLRQLN
ncbi:unnamed protein product [Rotaria magnacalcarata]|uniref:Uncharacterized protein n=2 Tax=Rotaria magnacalcarata TaxID=392030 RepID=A0A816ZPE2_9BILA|nr:unnamed protein product [Rotaria magnacalcarata]CAF2218976.1 unnamed protein product [Rotaria magnacalcarata]CAF5140067.1 unnamed protein product [Rotaria magnacalcarata]